MPSALNRDLRPSRDVCGAANRKVVSPMSSERRYASFDLPRRYALFARTRQPAGPCPLVSWSAASAATRFRCLGFRRSAGPAALAPWLAAALGSSGPRVPSGRDLIGYLSGRGRRCSRTGSLGGRHSAFGPRSLVAVFAPLRARRGGNRITRHDNGDAATPRRRALSPAAPRPAPPPRTHRCRRCASHWRLTADSRLAAYLAPPPPTTSLHGERTGIEFFGPSPSASDSCDPRSSVSSVPYRAMQCRAVPGSAGRGLRTLIRPVRFPRDDSGWSVRAIQPR